LVNRNQIKYWIKADKKFLLSLLKGNKLTDFDWTAYHFHYEEELKEMEKNYTLILENEDVIYTDGKIFLKNKKIKPLLRHHKFLLETILQLTPSTILEVGCGWGDHLHNLSILNPNLELFGIEISNKQVENLKKRHPDLKVNLEIVDITCPNYQISKCDIVYTNAVLMHTKDYEKHLTALTNLFKIAKNQIVLKENWKSHNFLDDVKKLYADKKIPWDEIFYYVKSDEKVSTRIMIISSKKLDLPNLSNHSQLLEEFA